MTTLDIIGVLTPPRAISILKSTVYASFEKHQVYRALGVIAFENDYIQSHLYLDSLKLIKRKTGVIFYDCTNFFYEIEKEDDFRKYGVSKEHRPNPIVQMGLFMDHDVIPPAFIMNPGRTNEQLTLQPLEEKLLAPDRQRSLAVISTAFTSTLRPR